MPPRRPIPAPPAGAPVVSARQTVQVFDDPAAIDAQQWNALVEAQPSATPFMRHEYLQALHASGSASPAAGWTAALRRACSMATRWLAACPLYLKDHSYGEYVFDWAWADAYRRHGLDYYPKLLGAVPFTPVPGPRLLARDDDASRDLLLQALPTLAEQAGLSSVHLLFLDDADREAARRAGWLLRSAVQFHWSNRDGSPYADFDDFLASLQRDKRKKIQQERRKVAAAGVGFAIRRGQRDRHGRLGLLLPLLHPHLPRAPLDALPDARLLRPHGRQPCRSAGCSSSPSAAASRSPARWSPSMRQRGHAFGRYWGAVESVDCLHFEACYYQPLEWCIAHGFRRFEGGAQGEHKMARGLLPVATASAHWLAHPRFAAGGGRLPGARGRRRSTATSTNSTSAGRSRRAGPPATRRRPALPGTPTA